MSNKQNDIIEEEAYKRFMQLREDDWNFADTWCEDCFIYWFENVYLPGLPENNY